LIFSTKKAQISTDLIHRLIYDSKSVLICVIRGETINFKCEILSLKREVQNKKVPSCRDFFGSLLFKVASGWLPSYRFKAFIIRTFCFTEREGSIPFWNKYPIYRRL